MHILNPKPTAATVDSARQEHETVDPVQTRAVVFLSNRKANSDELFEYMSDEIVNKTTLARPKVLKKSGPGSAASDHIIREISDPGIYVIVGTGD